MEKKEKKEKVEKKKKKDDDDEEEPAKKKSGLQKEIPVDEAMSQFLGSSSCSRTTVMVSC